MFQFFFWFWSANPNWEGGQNGYRGPNWDRQRRKARKRDNDTCQHCGITSIEVGQELDVHHKIPFRHFGIERYKEANHLSNLITLCRTCHSEAETQLRQQERSLIQ